MNERNFVALTILQQLGGKQFLILTGTKATLDGSCLRLKLVKNKSGANRMDISLNSNDTYDISAYHYLPYKCSFNKKTCEFTERAEKTTLIEQIEDIYCDMLKDIFEQLTGLYITLFPRK